MRTKEAREDGIPARCLAGLLKSHNYATAFFQTDTATFENRTQLVRNFGYDHFTSLEDLDHDGYEMANYFGLEDDAMLPKSREWLEANRASSLFAIYMTLPPHHDYLAPKRYGRRDFADDDTLNRYLNSVRYLDHFVKNFMDQYKALGLYDNTVFFIVGDHGEGFGEHGRNVHDTVIWNEGLQIPLIVHDPAHRQPVRLSKRMSILDIVPTVLPMIGFPLDDSGCGGVAYAAGGGVFSHCWREKACMSIVKGKLKPISHFNNCSTELIRWRRAVNTYYFIYYRGMSIEKIGK